MHSTYGAPITGSLPAPGRFASHRQAERLRTQRGIAATKFDQNQLYPQISADQKSLLTPL